MDNEKVIELLNKAAISRATGGQLTTQQAKSFIDLVVNQSEFLKKIQTVQMTSGTYQLNTIDIADRVMREAVEGVAPTEVFGVKITPRSLTAKEVILPFDVTYSWLEENIEGKDAESKLNAMFAKAFRNNNLDLAINGDESLAATITDTNTDGIDDTTGLSQNDHWFLRVNDGWFKLAENDPGVHVVTIPVTPIWRGVFKDMLKAMPQRWKVNKSELVFLVAPDIYEEYQDEVAERSTLLGDKVLENGSMIKYSGINIEPLAYVPGGSNPKIMLTKYKNLAMGIGRQIRSERQVQSRKRVIEYTITAKTDYNYVVSDMVVIAKK